MIVTVEHTFLTCAHVGTLLEIRTYSFLLYYLHENLVNVHARSATCIRVA